MTVTLAYDRFFAYSEKNKKYFNTEFDKGVNIVYGRNTSGKTTLFLSILYTFGINDGNQYLKDLLQEKVIFRIDCTLTKEGINEQFSIVREDDTLFIKRSGVPLKRFNGISGNRSEEHIQLKEYLNGLFDYSLRLESQSELKVAPIETMFLPYYISQTVGWVYLRRSFSGLDFYKNFKEDYLDYYFGLDLPSDRIKRHELQAKLKTKQAEIALITRFETNNEVLQLTRLTDETFIATSGNYVRNYSEQHSSLIEKENKYVLLCNELGFQEERQTILRKVSSGLKMQQPEIGNCPTCEQTLPIGLAASYKHFQGVNDTEQELSVVKAKIKDLKSKINSLQKSISEARETIAGNYSVLNKYVNSDISYEKWMKNKANVELINNLHQQIGELMTEREAIEKNLSELKTEEDLVKARITQGNTFATLLGNYLDQLGVKRLEEDRYTNVYQISAFPSQGVELHKTVMAYHFAFNKKIASTEGIHRLPLMLDAIFKEDLDQGNKVLILKFINQNKPADTQTIFSIAQKEGQVENAASFNQAYFSGQAKLIAIGNATDERAFLSKYNGEVDEYLNETLDLIAGVGSA